MDGESLLNLLQQNLISHPEYSQITHKLKCDVQTHPTRDEQRTLLSALSKYDKEKKLVTTVQNCLLSLGHSNVNSAASHVLVSLIKKDKSTVFVLHQFLNQPLPSSLRQTLWETILGDESVGVTYTDTVRDKPYSTLSPQQNTIKEKARAFIKSTVGYSKSAFLHSSTGHQLMVKCLSYWHIHVGRPLADSDYKLIIPIIALSWGDAEVATVTSVVSLLSGLFSLQSRLKAADSNTMNIVVQYMQSAAPELSEHVMLLRADTNHPNHTSPTAQLIAPLHDKLFVGYLSEDVIKFLLDQCCISKDVPSHNPLFFFTATVLCELAPALSQCNNVSSALSHIEQGGPNITVKQIQQFVQQHFIDTLSAQLSAKPTRVQFNSKPTTLGQTDSESNRRLQNEIEDLKRKLAEEKKQRNEKHVTYRNEIGQLRADNEELQRKLKAQKASHSTSDSGSETDIAPPLPVSDILRDPSTQEDTQEEDQDDGDISAPLEAPLRPKQIETLWLDIAKNIVQRVKRLAFKNPARKAELDLLTFHLNKQYEEDRKTAEIELFGAEIPDEDWELMDEEEFYDKIYQIDTVVDRLARARYDPQEPADSEGNKDTKKSKKGKKR